jgi:hypothetical protein
MRSLRPPRAALSSFDSASFRGSTFLRICPQVFGGKLVSTFRAAFQVCQQFLCAEAGPFLNSNPMSAEERKVNRHYELPGRIAFCDQIKAVLACVLQLLESEVTKFHSLILLAERAPAYGRRSGHDRIRPRVGVTEQKKGSPPRFPALPPAAIAAKPSPAIAGLGAGLVYIEDASFDLKAIEGCYRFVGLRRIGHFNERETTRTTGVTVGNEIYPIDSAIGFEQRTDGGFGRAEVQVADEDVLHSASPSFLTEQRDEAGLDGQVLRDDQKRI